ncbi:DUF4340 domain-containing protein [Alteromonas sp. ASW11-130]|uniref:DUF4340 domain-containing protein n=1 Tax=Alteromonas sp. ASW11-130 TaxID=3015775 RepID=UPI002242BEA8|nr:DUF4340 domain-containing protein [Alteromonas sp. ASW11-130]MCW8091537.1 DUF4340 domain-containing protein [Alteromonas sp. ASW11-130]
MNIRLVILISLVVVTSATVYWLHFYSEQPDQTVQSLWLDNLGEQGGSVDEIEVVNSTGTVFKAHQKKEKWLATHLDPRLGFPVDKDALAALMMSLSQAKVVERKTANPEYYHRLGVEEITKQDAQSTRLLLKGGKHSWRVIIGNEASNGLGTYVRTAGNKTSLLVDQTFNLPSGPTDWLSKRILPFTKEDVVKVVVRYRDNQPVQFVKGPGPEEVTWQLTDLQDNEKLIYPGVISQTVADLTSLKYDSVIPYVENQWEEERLIGDITFTLADHSQVFAYMTQANDQGSHKVWFSMPDNPSWVSDWVFLLSEFTTKSYMTGRTDIVKPAESGDD